MIFYFKHLIVFSLCLIASRPVLAQSQWVRVWEDDFSESTATVPSPSPLNVNKISGKPQWLSINPYTGLLSGTPTLTDAKINSITLEMESAGVTSSLTVDLIVEGGYDPNDSDRDGLLDAWELAEFGDLSTSSGTSHDLDGDGYSDREEQVAGTDPEDANSKLDLSLINTADGLSVTIEGVAGRNYLLQTKSDLLPGSWYYGDSIHDLNSNQTVVLKAQQESSTGKNFGRIVVTEAD